MTIKRKFFPILISFLPFLAQGAEGFYLPDELSWAQKPKQFENALLTPNKKHDEVMSVIYPSSAIYTEVLKNLGEDAAKRIFNCKSI